MTFSFLDEYKITSGQIEILGVKTTERLRHQFFSLLFGSRFCTLTPNVLTIAIGAASNARRLYNH
jgi:hypothetical protein